MSSVGRSIDPRSPAVTELGGVALLSAAVLLLQVALTRVFSIAQSYHFAFLVISLALLGFGASGSLLAVAPGVGRSPLRPWLAIGFGLSALGGYLFVNLRSFDSYRIAWDPAQVWLLVANLLALAIPFAFAGAAVGGMLRDSGHHAGRVYGANLLGSGLGAGLAPLVLNAAGSERSVVACAAMAAIAAIALGNGSTRFAEPAATTPSRRRPERVVAVGALLLAVGLAAALPQPFEIRPSPYKRLSQLRGNPDARIVATRQDASSRLDVVVGGAVHSAPGLSLAYAGDLPPQAGLIVDGSDLLPVADAGRSPPSLAESLPISLAHTLRPAGDVLLLGSGGGMDAWVASTRGARTVTVVEPNALVFGALTRDLRDWAGLAGDPAVELVHAQIRGFAEGAGGPYDVVEVVLADEYRPVSSGAFSLTENYLLTVEAMRTYLRLAGSDGLVVVTRWAQTRPTESLRTLGLVAEALAPPGGGGRPDLARHVIAFRTFQTVTFMVKPSPFTETEMNAALAGLERLRYDLVLAPRVPADLVNRYARVERPLDHELAVELAAARDRDAFYRAHPFDVTPPTDDRPFFFHFFRWEQTPAVLENLGRRWQPFGGSGYFVLLSLLLFALAAAVLFVVVPVATRRPFRAALAAAGRGRSARTLLYFTSLGLAFLLVEVVLVQRWMLVLGQPTLALAAVVGPLLVSSGAGSLVSSRVPWRGSIVGLAIVVVLYAVAHPLVVPILLPLPLEGRAASVALLTVPVGFLMGIPFARGVAALRDAPSLVAWAWAANGGASVASGILAATIALSVGFTVVLAAAAGLYVVAALLAPARVTSQARA